MHVERVTDIRIACGTVKSTTLKLRENLRKVTVDFSRNLRTTTSKPIASESKEGHETIKSSRKRGGDDEGKEDGDEIIEGAVDDSTTLTNVSAAPAATD